MKSRATTRGSSVRTQALEQGRESFRKQAWGAAFSQLSAADQEAPLDPEHVVELAQAALLIGKEVEGGDFLARAHQAFLSRGDAHLAVRCAFWLGFTSLLNGEVAKAGGWLSRASRLLDGHPDCVERGYLLLPTGYRLVHGGDAAAAQSTFAQATAIGNRFGDKDLVTLGLHGQGRALIRHGEVSRGLALLDEAMVAVTAGEVSPLNAGGVYCSVLDACGEIFDLQRAQEWTSALEKWCASQPDLVPYRGHCLVRRAELLQFHGAWSDALEEAKRASEWLSHPSPKPAVGGAFYQVAELQRLRGKFADAEQAYRQASQWRSPGPGLAQLRLAQGQVDAANAAIRRMAEEVQEPGPRALVLDAYVEIALAANDVAAARGASDELAEIAARQSIPFLRALSSRASGAVLLAEGNAPGALAELRQSWSIWSELQVPYEASRVRCLIALACRKLGDEENALLELAAARQTFQELGAAVELARVEGFVAKDADHAAGPLTDRELQVLRLVATGMTNRGIGGKLNISEKTVARHLSNIFTKLDLYSRTAAAAYAYDHDLV
jgi:DNA-binding CsgD family transcriptional regulator